MNSKPLSVEQLTGTRTAFLPLCREGRRPEATLVFERVSKETFAVGVAVCSLVERFIKAEGQKKAFHRLKGKPFCVGTPDEICEALVEYFELLNVNRPGTVSDQSMQDVGEVADQLQVRFNRMEKQATPEACEPTIELSAGKAE